MKMRAALAAAVLAVPALALAAPGDPNPEIRRIVSEIDPARIEATVRTLAAFGTRNSFSEVDSATRGIGAARRWIKGRLDECARDSGGRLQVAFDEHRVESGPRVPRPTTFVNVVATLPGEQEQSRGRIYVVSGHYDSIPSNPVDGVSDAPGADDDGSGTAVSMELACVMARHRFDATLVFLAVSGEEQGLYGSTAWAKDARAKGLDIEGMITNDIVGATRSEEGLVDQGRVRLFARGVPAVKELPDDVLAALRTGGENDLPTRQLARAIASAAALYVPGLHVQVVWRLDRYLRGGDHFPFLQEGYPAVRFTEPVEDWRHQHQDVRVENGVQYGDLPQFMDFGYVAQVARVNAAALASLALAPAPPRDVEIEALRLEHDTTLAWAPDPEPDLAGYRIVWRETTAADWQHAKDVGNVTRATLTGVSKDDYLFGVEAYDRDGNVSPAAYPRPTRRPAPATAR
ncbi:MAG TPA: M28 family metallopeptidase [Usitatibacter sp.]|nr:M28 family metallopeptidase [Usitatibacter sp.]